MTSNTPAPTVVVTIVVTVVVSEVAADAGDLVVLTELPRFTSILAVNLD